MRKMGELFSFLAQNWSVEKCALTNMCVRVYVSVWMKYERSDIFYISIGIQLETIALKL